MRIVNKEISVKSKTRKFYFEQFSNYQEYLDVVEERMKTNCHNRNRNFEDLAEDESWSGVKNYQEAKDLLLKGWDKEVEVLKKAIDKEVQACDNKQVIKYFNDMVGFMPVVPNVIMNLPLCMLNQKKDMKKQKVIKFLVGMNRSWRYSSEQIISKMSKIFARIVLLEKNGYRCRIEMFGQHSEEYGSKTIVAHTVLIKSENQLMDVKRVCFPVIHSAMQRVFSFGWENTLPIDYDSYHDSGLGTAIQYWDEDARQSILNAVNEKKEKVVYVSLDTDIDKMFGEGGEVYGK